MLSGRNQFNGERVKEYATELKRLPHKAYQNKSKRPRQEDLLERFMRSIIVEVRFFVSYMKNMN